MEIIQTKMPFFCVLDGRRWSGGDGYWPNQGEPDKDHVTAWGPEVGGGQFVHLAAVDGEVEAEVEALHKVLFVEGGWSPAVRAAAKAASMAPAAAVLSRPCPKWALPGQNPFLLPGGGFPHAEHARTGAP